MASTRKSLTGRRGWTVVVGLSTALTVLVAGNLPTASAQDASAAQIAATEPVAPVAPVAPAATTSVADRPAGPNRPTALPAAKPAAKPAVKPAVKKAPKRAARVANASVAKPAAPGLCSGDGWQQRRGQAALDSLRPGAAARTGFRIEFMGARKGYMGLTHLDERRIEMFVRACGAQSDELLRHVMAHELGHAYDTVRNNAALRAAWQAARGIPASTPWYGCSGCTDFATPAGDFAEVYAQWARGASTNRSQLAGDVPPAQLSALASRFFGA